MKFARKWMPKDLIDTESTLVQVMAWCHQVPSTYLNQYLQISWCHMVSPCRGRHYGRLLHSLNVLRFAHSNWYVEINNHNTSNYNKKEWYYKVTSLHSQGIWKWGTDMTIDDLSSPDLVGTADGLGPGAMLAAVDILSSSLTSSGGRLNKKDGLTRYGDSHVKDKTS